MSDPINPRHYKHLPAEAIDIIDAAIEGAPSPQAAAAQSHLLGYALRANQKGQLAIDAGKAEWYAARWLKAIREAEAKASGANETPSDEPSEDRIPSGWRKMEIGEDIEASDKFWFCTNWMSYEKDNLPRGKLTGLHVTHIRRIDPPTKQYREPTQADLRDGPMKCEYRDNDDEQWRSGFVVYILDGSMPFLCVDKMDQFSGQWNQCRIEVTE